MKNPLDDKPELAAYVKQQDVDALDNFIMEMNWRQLRTLRMKQNKAQRDISDEIGVSVPTYSKIENGKQIPSRAQAVNLAGAFGFKGSVLDLAAAFDKELRDAMEADTTRKLERMKTLHHELQVKQAEYTARGQDAGLIVDRKRIPYYNVINKAKELPLEQTVLFIKEDTDLINTPPMLAGIEDAYAIVAPNQNMHPAYGESDTVFVHPGRVPKNGDDVVVRLSFEDREIGFIRSVWDTNAVDSKEGEPVFFDLISYAQRDVAKLYAAAKVGDPEDLGKIVTLASEMLQKSKWTLTGTPDGKQTLAGTGHALPKITDATVDVIVGCQRKMGNAFGRGNFGSNPFGG